MNLCELPGESTTLWIPQSIDLHRNDIDIFKMWKSVYVFKDYCEQVVSWLELSKVVTLRFEGDFSNRHVFGQRGNAAEPIA